jgi:F-type H+/Na+-transporting ATPase subunit beta
MLETGIKVIDLLCPLPIGGTVGLAGDMQSGKMVLIGELAHRLSGGEKPPSILVFTEVTTEAAMIQGSDVPFPTTIESVYLPVADASPEAIGQTMSRLDTVITLSRHLGKQRLYPAIDPLRSTSRLLDFAIVGRDHYDVAINVRTLLTHAAQLPADNLSPADQLIQRRASLLQHYFTQPFFTTEAFTNLSRQFVPIQTTIADCQAIVSGTHDDLSAETLFMVGPIHDALGKA